MKAVLFEEHGTPDVLRLETVPDPIPAPDEVIVRVGACAVNHLDVWMRKGVRGWQIPLPHVLGNDIAGEVAAVGSGVNGWVTGERVMVHPGLFCGNCRFCIEGRTNLCETFGIIGAQRWGGYADYVAVPARNLGHMPQSLSFPQAAALPLVFLTAWHMIIGRGNAVSGETALVMAAASGVGTAAIQMARMAGMRVIAAAGSSAKLSFAMELGADATVDYSQPNWSREVRKLTGGDGVDLVIEHTGGELFDEAIKAMAKGGRLVTCGATAGFVPQLDLRYVYSRELQVIGSMLGRRDEFDMVLQAVEAGHLRPIVDTIMPLAEARTAHERMEARDVRGKLVLVP